MHDKNFLQVDLFHCHQLQHNFVPCFLHLDASEDHLWLLIYSWMFSIEFSYQIMVRLRILSHESFSFLINSLKYNNNVWNFCCKRKFFFKQLHCQQRIMDVIQNCLTWRNPYIGQSTKVTMELALDPNVKERAQVMTAKTKTYHRHPQMIYIAKDNKNESSKEDYIFTRVTYHLYVFWRNLIHVIIYFYIFCLF